MRGAAGREVYTRVSGCAPCDPGPGGAVRQDAFDARFWAIVASVERQHDSMTTAMPGASTRTVMRLVFVVLATGAALGACFTATGRPWWLALAGVIYVVPASAWVSVLVVDGIKSSWGVVRANLTGSPHGQPVRGRL